MGEARGAGPTSLQRSHVQERFAAGRLERHGAECAGSGQRQLATKASRCEQGGGGHDGAGLQRQRGRRWAEVLQHRRLRGEEGEGEGEAEQYVAPPLAGRSAPALLLQLCYNRRAPSPFCVLCRPAPLAARRSPHAARRTPAHCTPLVSSSDCVLAHCSVLPPAAIQS